MGGREERGDAQGSPSGVTLWCPLLAPSSVIGSTLTRIVRGPGSVPGWGLSNAGSMGLIIQLEQRVVL